MAVDDDAHVSAEAVGMPTVNFAMHKRERVLEVREVLEVPNPSNPPNHEYRC